jgi:large subunit ribosomal protein L10
VKSKSVKEQAIKDLHDRLLRAKVAIVAEPKNIDVETVTALRKTFRNAKVEYKVVKNTLARRALAGTGAELMGGFLKGPTAIIMGYEDPISPAKTLQAFMKEKADRIVVRGAVIDGKAIDAKGVEALAKLPGANELRATLLGMLCQPAQRLASILNQPATQLARVIEARRESESSKA